MKEFVLSTFHQPPPLFIVSGGYFFNDDSLDIRFRIKGPQGSLNLEQQSHSPQRRNELWKKTCFEVFLLSENGEYLEFNLNSNGDWNAYHFNSYRQGMSPYQIESLPFSKEQEEQFLNIEFSIKKDAFVTKCQSIGLCCITQEEEKLHYWSLSHPEDKPDFHLADHYIEIQS